MRGRTRSASWLIISALLVLAACGGGEQGADQGTTPVEEAPTAAGTPADSATDAATPAAAAEGERPGAPAPEAVSAAVTEACTPENAPRIAEIAERGTLAWGIGISPPFGFKDAQGEFAGIEADNAAELAGILGVDYSIRDYDYGVMTAALQSNQVDIIGAQLFITEEREQAIDFSVPYYLSGQLFYVLEDSPWQTIEDLNSPENRFVYGTGGAQKELAEKYIPEAEIFDAPLRGQLLLYEFLVSGQADSSMVESAPLGVLKAQYTSPQLTAIGLKGRIEGDEAAPDEVIDPFDVAFGLPPDEAGWKGCIDAWVTDMIDSGRMKERLDYWLSQGIAG